MAEDRSKRIKIPLYYGQITILQVNDLQSVEKKYGLGSVRGYEAFCFKNHTKKGYTRYVLAFTNKVTPAIIAHESCHVVNDIFEDTDINLDLQNDEPQCYLLGWIVGECHKFLKVENSK